MNILFCIFAFVIFPKTNAFTVITETSLNAWTFTPRYSIEPYPGYQVFLINGLRCSCPLLSNNRISLGFEAGFVNRFHFTHFYSYASWGLGECHLWLSVNGPRSVSLLARLNLPTGPFNEGLGTGAYHLELYARKANILRNSSAYIGYEWRGSNPDRVDYGDRIHLGVEITTWLRIASNYAFADQGTYYPLDDSPSFIFEIALFKDFRLMKAYTLQAIFSQTVLGRDMPISTSFSLRIYK